MNCNFTYGSKGCGLWCLKLCLLHPCCPSTTITTTTLQDYHCSAVSQSTCSILTGMRLPESLSELHMRSWAPSAEHPALDLTPCAGLGVLHLIDIGPCQLPQALPPELRVLRVESKQAFPFSDYFKFCAVRYL